MSVRNSNRAGDASTMMSGAAPRIVFRSRENRGGRQRFTPALQAGLMQELWTMERLYHEVIA